MNDMNDSETDQPGLIRKSLKVLSYPVSAAVALYYGHGSARDESYNNFKSIEMFKTDYDIRKEEALDVLKRDAPGVKVDLRPEIEAIEKKYSVKVEEIMASKGYDTMWKRFKSLHHNQKLGTVMTALTAGGVSLGVLLTIANSKGLFHKAAAKEAQQGGDDTKSR